MTTATCNPKVQLLSRCSLLLLPFVLVALFTGCATSKPSFIPDHERADSFRPFADTVVSNQTLCVFVKHRTAIIVRGLTAQAGSLGSETASIQFDAEPNQSLGSGQAVAIEPDGYFLTAAHCLDRRTNYLVFWDGQKVGVAAPRVVAMINDPANHRDLAILHVDAKLKEVFTWATTEVVHDSTTAVGVGCSALRVLDKTHASISLACLGGHIESVKKLKPGGWMVFSNLPTRNGDSGGPLLDSSGRLIGIHFAVRTRPLTHPRAMAFRPDREWLTRVIELDRLNPATSTQLVLPPLGRATKGLDPVLMVNLKP